MKEKLSALSCRHARWRLRRNWQKNYIKAWTQIEPDVERAGKFYLRVEKGVVPKPEFCEDPSHNLDLLCQLLDMNEDLGNKQGNGGDFTDRAPDLLEGLSIMSTNWSIFVSAMEMAADFSSAEEGEDFGRRIEKWGIAGLAAMEFLEEAARHAGHPREVYAYYDVNVKVTGD